MTPTPIVRMRLVALFNELLSRDDTATLERAPTVIARGSSPRVGRSDLGELVELSVKDSHDLTELVAAMDRLDAGTYGTCIGCGDDVGNSRLLDTPAVALCSGCADHNKWRP